VIRTGCVRDWPDPRDFVYRPPPGALFGQGDVDLREYMPPIRDQIAENCTGHAVAAQVWAYHAVRGRKPPEYSTIWPWTNGRICSGAMPLLNSGTNLRSVYKGMSGQTVRDQRGILTGLGMVSEADWPEVEANINAIPPEDLYREGGDDTIGPYARLPEGIDALAAIDAALDAKMPVTACLVVDMAFANIGQQVYHGPDGSEVLGGHATLIVGRVAAANAYRLRNSWSLNFGVDGYCLIDRGTVANHVYDIWGLL